MKYFVLIVIANITLGINAQIYKGELKEYKMESSAFDKERKIVVYTPPSYYSETQDNYPVIYLFDGQFQALMDMTTGTMDYMSQMGLFMEHIVVAIVTEDRPKEFTPKPINEKTQKNWGEDRIVGKAHVLEGHLVNEVFPFVETNYRTKPLRIGIGHSLGGTFVLNTIINSSNLFKGVVAISPNVSYDYKQLVSTYDQFLKNKERLDKFIYVSAGTVGNMENGFRKSMRELDHVIKYHNPKGLIYNFEVYENQNHSQTPASSLSKAFSEFYKIMSIPEDKIENILSDESKELVGALKTHYKDLSDWLGYELVPTSNEVNGFGYSCIYEEKFEDAVKVFEWGNSMYPKDANLYDSKGEALEKQGNIVMAKASYKMALETLKKNKSSYSEDNYKYYYNLFKKNYDRM